MAAKKIENPTSDPLNVYCRLRWLRIDEPKQFQEGADPRWEATGILDPSDVKGQAGIQLLLSTAARMSKETYGVVPLAIKKLAAKFIPGTKQVDLNDPANQDDKIQIPFVDGDTKPEYAGYAGMFIAAAHNSKIKTAVANRKGLTVQPGDEQYPYDGCFGYLRTTIWIHATHGSYAKRCGLNLRGVQFAADGQPFTQDVLAAEDEFTPLAEDAPATVSASDFD